jgi:hypothetical protein
MKITVNAPSYRRATGVDTLKYIPVCKIWVCETEFAEYKKANPGAEIVKVKKGIQGNLCRIRNHILDSEFAAGVEAVCLVDDDLQRIEYFENKKRKRLLLSEINYFLFKFTLMADELGAKLWGINVSDDKQFYREYNPFSMVAYIGGPFSVHLRNPIRYDEALPLKEDYDMTLQHCNKYRRVLRANKFFFQAKQSASGTSQGQRGGCAVYRNIESEKRQLFLLQRKWGSRVVQMDIGETKHDARRLKRFDLNPIIKIPIRGV